MAMVVVAGRLKDTLDIQRVLRVDMIGSCFEKKLIKKNLPDRNFIKTASSSGRSDWNARKDNIELKEN